MKKEKDWGMGGLMTVVIIYLLYLVSRLVGKGDLANKEALPDDQKDWLFPIDTEIDSPTWRTPPFVNGYADVFGDGFVQDPIDMYDEPSVKKSSVKIYDLETVERATDSHNCKLM